MAKKGNSGSGRGPSSFDEDDDDLEEGSSDELLEELGDAVALFPDVPAEMGVDPVLLGLLHCVVFLCGSNDEMVHPQAADLVMQQVMECCSRLNGAQLKKVREDMQVLASWSKDQGHGQAALEFLETFLDEMGAGKGQ